MKPFFGYLIFQKGRFILILWKRWIYVDIITFGQTSFRFCCSVFSNGEESGICSDPLRYVDMSVRNSFLFVAMLSSLTIGASLRCITSTKVFCFSASMEPSMPDKHRQFDWILIRIYWVSRYHFIKAHKFIGIFLVHGRPKFLWNRSGAYSISTDGGTCQSCYNSAIHYLILWLNSNRR